MDIEIFEEDGEHTLSFENESADFTIDVFPESKTYRSRMRLKDDVYYRTQRYEYRIKTDPIKVETRLIERVDEPPERYCVKDGVVLESEIRKKHAFRQDDFIDGLKKEVEWHEEWAGDPVSMYLLSKHPDVISPDDYRRYLRLLSEKIKTATQKVEKALESDQTGLQIIDDEYGRSVWYPKEQLEKLDDEEVAKLRENASKFRRVFDENTPEYIGISADEFSSGNEVLGHTETFLNKKPTTAKKEEAKKVSVGAKFGAFVIQWIWLFLLVSIALWLLSLIVAIIQYNVTFAFVASGILTIFFTLRERRQLL